MFFFLTEFNVGVSGPFQNIEFVLQITGSMVGAIFQAFFVGQIQNMQTSRDNTNSTAFKEKLRTVEQLCKFRNFTPELQQAMRRYYEHMWDGRRSLGDNNLSYLALLTRSLTSEILLEIHRDRLSSISLLSSCSKSAKCAFSLHMQSQQLAPGTVLFSEHDSENCMFFVTKGLLSLFPAAAEQLSKKVAYINSLSDSLLKLKSEAFQTGRQEVGCHFGETFITSENSNRGSVATALEASEVFIVSKDSMFEVLSAMPHTVRCQLILDMFVTNGERRLGPSPPVPDDTSSITDSFSKAAMFKLASELLEIVLVKFAVEIDEGSISMQRDENKRRPRTFSMDEVEGEVAPAQASRWTAALTQYHNKSFSVKNESQSTKRHRSDSISDLKEMINNAKIASKSDSPQVVAEIEALVEKMFVFFDKDGSGNIDRDELMHAMHSLGMDVSWNDVDDMIRAADKNGNNEVDIKEITQAIVNEILGVRTSGKVVVDSVSLKDVNEMLAEWKLSSTDNYDGDREEAAIPTTMSSNKKLASWTEAFATANESFGRSESRGSNSKDINSSFSDEDEDDDIESGNILRKLVSGSATSASLGSSSRLLLEPIVGASTKNITPVETDKDVANSELPTFLANSETSLTRSDSQVGGDVKPFSVDEEEANNSYSV